MATENQNENVQTQETQPENTFTQADIDRIINKRFAKYADYDELKAKAERLDEIEEANKTELQKVTERADRLQAPIPQHLSPMTSLTLSMHLSVLTAREHHSS